MVIGKLGYRSLSRAWLGRPGSPSTEPSHFPISGVSTTASTGKSYTKNQLALKLFEQPYVTSKTVERLFDVKQPTASRVINDLVDEGVLEEVTGKERNKEYRAREIFEILEQPPQTY